MYKISCAKKLNIPNLLSLGLGNVSLLENVLFNGVVIGSYGKMEEKSAGKDSTTGHWEIAGLILDKPFPVFHSFPDTIINSFIEKTGINGILGNYPASGTEIINKLGVEHYKTKMPIIYTSADSVFQVAASEEVFGLNNLYHLCEVARNEILVGEYAVARVIARPFIKEGNSYIRTANRRDFSLKPFNRTMLNYMQDFGIKTYGIGKIDDLFAGYGLDIKLHTKSNSEGIDITINLIKDIKSGFIFVNLVDFDMLYGHRNDALGFAEALEYFDYKLSEIISSLDEKDLLIITADHGNDPADISTDHTREYVPLLVYSKEHKNPKNLGVRSSFCDIAKTVLEYYNIENSLFGKSFLKYLN